ncbi:tetratricopeptide repeat protein, partial [Micromonospora sp. BL4]
MAAAQHRALALRAAGDLSAAKQLLTEAVGSARPSYGEDHPEVLHTAHLLARLHREADDPLAARRLLEEAFAAGERRWEHSDPAMLALAFELAEVAEELGNRHEARRNYTRVATAGPAVLGEHHPAVRAARHYLGEAAPAPAERRPAPPAPRLAPDDRSPGPVPADDAGTRAALSGPTLSLATLAAMRPSAGSRTAGRTGGQETVG